MIKAHVYVKLKSIHLFKDKSKLYFILNIEVLVDSVLISVGLIFPLANEHLEV